MFYYTNFIAETNAWWLRRFRPIWLGGIAIGFYWFFHKYYFFGKLAAKYQRSVSKEENERRAALNKRDFGFGHYFQPKYANSRKRLIMDLLGEDYDRAVQFEDRMMEFSSFEQLQAQIDEENDY